jgi:hypothetical protein
MLSIGKLAVGQAGYYLEQAHGSVTRSGALRSGVEDYYLGGPEAAGVWVGDGVRGLGLAGGSTPCASIGCSRVSIRPAAPRSGEWWPAAYQAST